MSEIQKRLDTGVEPGETGRQTVYVVVVRWDGSPHPDVLGVFEDESDADALMRKCRNWPHEWDGLGPVAWEKREQDVRVEYDGEEP